MSCHSFSVLKRYKMNDVRKLNYVCKRILFIRDLWCSIFCKVVKLKKVLQVVILTTVSRPIKLCASKS